MSVLFDKTSIKGMELKNRLVRSATHEGMADANGFPTKQLFNLYERLAKGGVGLIVTGHSYISENGKTDNMLGINDDEYIQRYRELVDHVHANGAKIAMQINHCGRQTTKDMTGTQTIAPSAIRDKMLFDKPRAMTEKEIEGAIASFGKCAKRVKDSNFDAVQLHGAHGYLISSFLCPYTNRRKDKWGGSIENRMRFVQEVYRSCRSQVGDDYPIFIKINAYDNMKKGLKKEEGIIMAEMMADMGVDAIEVSCGIGEDGISSVRGDLHIDVALEKYPMYKKQNPVLKFIMKHFGEQIIKPVPFSESYNRSVAREIKAKVKIPIFVVGGMTDPSVMEDVIEKGDADYISLCRALIANPGFPEKIAGGSREPSMCIHCNLCVYNMYTSPLRCFHGNKEKLMQI